MNIGTQVLVHLGPAHHSDFAYVGFVTYVHTNGKVNVAGFKEDGSLFALTPAAFHEDPKDYPLQGAYAFPYDAKVESREKPREKPQLAPASVAVTRPDLDRQVTTPA